MKRTALHCLLIASSLIGSTSLADPLHKYGDDGAWCHVDSGFLFPAEVANFSRVLQPYNIDGNNDAGAEYRQESARLRGEVDVYAADSAATDATIDGAKTTAASKAGEGASIKSEKPFTVGGEQELRGVKVTYLTKGTDARTNLYYFTTDKWRVKVLVSGEKKSDKALDAFVKALPWKSLGTQSGIH